MFWVRLLKPCLRRFFHGTTLKRDHVLEQIQACSVEEQLFEIVGTNRTTMTADHVSCAVSMLWNLRKSKSDLHIIEEIKNHPKFPTLWSVAEDTIEEMDNNMLIDVLYDFHRLNVAPHEPVLQHLISEAWRRIESLSMPSLSKFSICLRDQVLQHSPLMGQITNILDQRLSSIDDHRVLFPLMLSVSRLVSPRLRSALILKADELIDSEEPMCHSDSWRIVKFLYDSKCSNLFLLDKCNKIFLNNMTCMDVYNIKSTIDMYHSLQFSNWDFKVAAERHLTELIDSSTDPDCFCKLFAALAPLTGPETRGRLENMALSLADEFSPKHALEVAVTLNQINSRNFKLMKRIALVIENNFDTYTSKEVVSLSEIIFLLRYKKPEFCIRLRKALINFLHQNVYPMKVAMLTRTLMALPCSIPDVNLVLRLDAMATQCNNSALGSMALLVTKWTREQPTNSNTHREYIQFIQKVRSCRQRTLQETKELDLLLTQLRHISGSWFRESMLEENMAALTSMADQIDWTNVTDVAFYLTRKSYFSPHLMDKIASVVNGNIEKIHYLSIYTILLPFCVLNYEPVHEETFFHVCIKCFTPHVASMDPILVIQIGYLLALRSYFPEELMNEIFSIQFLSRLDSQLKTCNNVFNMRTRQRLMDLNRAVCLEGPELQVPWFHEQFCPQVQTQDSIKSVHKQIHKVLCEVLGGNNFVQAAVKIPYNYTIDFECKLGKDMKPLPYAEATTLDVGTAASRLTVPESTRDLLPPGAQRVAIEFLNSSMFCWNSFHFKGVHLMRKRHLEILGYRVVEIPHFEWNSMELSTRDAWKTYLQKKIFG